MGGARANQHHPYATKGANQTQHNPNQSLFPTQTKGASCLLVLLFLFPTQTKGASCLLVLLFLLSPPWSAPQQRELSVVATSPAERSAIGNQSRSIGDHELVHACFMVSNAISCDSMSLRSKGSERILYILINRVDSHLVILTHIWRSETHQTVSYGLLLIRTCQ